MMNRVFILILMLLLSAVAVTASMTGWESYQDTKGSPGRFLDTPSNWTRNSVDYSITIGDGNNLQPLLVDWDGDSVPDLIQIMSNYVIVVHQTVNRTAQTAVTDVLTTLAYPLGNDSQTEPTMYENSNGSRFWVTIANNHLFQLAWDGMSVPTQVFSDSSSVDNCSDWTGIKCFEDSCFAICQNDGFATRGVRFNMTGGTYTVGNNLTNGSVNINLKGNSSLALTKIGSDLSSVRIVFACDPNKDGGYGLCMIDGQNLALVSAFSGDGIIDNIHNPATFWSSQFVSQGISSPIFSSLESNGIGNEHIIITYGKGGLCSGGGGVADPCIASYSVTGTNDWTTCADSVGSYTDTGTSTFLQCPDNTGSTSDQLIRLSQPFIAVYHNDLKICAMESVSTTAIGTLAMAGCLNGTNGARTIQLPLGVVSASTNVNYWGSVWSGSRITNGLSFANIVNTSDDQIIFGNLVTAFNASSTNTTPLVQTNLTSEYSASSQTVMTGDLDGDGNTDIIATSSTTASTQTFSRFVQSAFEFNDPPVVNNNLTYGGFTGYSTSPICGGEATTLLHFAAIQCPDDINGCNYFNDRINDREQIHTNCGTGTNSVGQFSLVNPTVACSYTTPGTYLVTLFLVDDANPTNFSAYNTQPIVINVIAGTPGVTCNIPGTFVTIPSQATTVSPADTGGFLNDIWASMFDFSSFGTRGRVFVSFLIILAVVIATLYIAQYSDMAVGIGAGLATFATWGVGILPTEIFVVILVTLALIITLVMTIGKRSQGM